MTNKRNLGLLCGAVAIFAAGFGTAFALGASKTPAALAEVKDLFDNPRVTVRAITMPSGSQREARPRPTDELVLFYEEAHYQATDAEGKVSPRDRTPGTVVWHKKGELAPTLSNLASATVPLFPVTTFITPVFEGGAQGQPIPFTQFIQQPQFSSVTIQTTVAVPDGGTVIMGGLKTLSEGRNEFGPPVLSKLPYVNRLFKNVGYGRETETVFLMVTPRVIVGEGVAE